MKVESFGREEGFIIPIWSFFGSLFMDFEKISPVEPIQHNMILDGYFCVMVPIKTII